MSQDKTGLLTFILPPETGGRLGVAACFIILKLELIKNYGIIGPDKDR